MTATRTRPPGAPDGPFDGTPGEPSTGGTTALRPRRALPGSRAVVGGLLVAVAAVGIFAAVGGAGRGPSTRYAVAAHDLPAGEVVTADDFEMVAVDLPEDVRVNAFARPDNLVGAVVVGPVASGELIQAGGLAAPTDGDVPSLSISIDRADANGGQLENGEFVQVFVTYGSGVTATTVAVSTDARVVVSSSGDDTLAASEQVLVRLAVPSAEERSAIINATVAGRITLVRTSGAGDVEATERFRPDVDPATVTDEPDAGTQGADGDPTGDASTGREGGG